MSTNLLSRSDVLLVGAATVIIVFAIVITAVVQGTPEKAFSQIITVGPVWSTDTWVCTSDANFMVHAALRGLAGNQISINVSGIGTQSLYTLEATQMAPFSIGADADRSIIITRTGTVSGFITLQTTSDAFASCISR